jgi:hypothetical protein
MIRGHIRVGVEKALPITKNVNTGEKDDDQANAEKDPKRNDRVGMRMEDGERGDYHLEAF